MARKKKAPPPPPGAPLYMATYGDMVTLVLCFFVLLFAMSSIDSQKFQKALISLRGSLGVLRGGVTTEESTQPNRSGEEGRDAGSAPRFEMDTRHVAHTVNSYLRAEGLDKSIRVSINQRGVAVSISDQFLFASGSAELRLEGQRALYKIAALVRDKVPAVAVEGHTDAVPLLGGIYRNNWGLSSMRAAVVAAYLETEGRIDPLKLQAVGFGPNQPVVPNDTPEHRALNRRVDLVFLSQYPKR
ncbi:MAG: flagellar motor protein MotB [Fretibacterium sp.]|uniref:OmpA/MotB family protein n=1 Tax=Fretibacterium sp. OH1220_COT-178 TaxID=2491047 RepID=UPI000F5FB1C9|nr:flagellar motor protein MotB [Fretibacterium sp. OH1220_COT-178]MDO4786771.1 flagellar motor protein MotB [Fretibacterium sp.]RRD66198.1 flagellar motor protein MotB [Fretibacterium sp. OH1220_COT-178]